MAEHPQRPQHCSLQSPLPFTFLPRFIKQIFVLLCVNEFYLKVAMTLQFLNPCLMDNPYSLTSSFPSLNLRACCSPVFDISHGWLSGVIQRWEMSFVLLFFFSSLIDLAGRCSYWRDAGKRKWADILGKWGNRTGQEVVPEVSARSELEPYQAWVSQFGAHCFTTGRAVWTVRTFPIDLSHLQQVLPIGYSFWKILLKKKTKNKNKMKASLSWNFRLLR